MAINPQSTEPFLGGPMSVETYLQLENMASDRKYEYIDGIARLMSGGSGEHDQIAHDVRNAIEQHLPSGPCFARGADMQVLVGTKRNGKEQYCYPDVSVSCDMADRRRGNKRIRSPRIVIEVLSPSTEALDRGKKLKAYQACPTIQEIVLLSQFARRVEIYQRGDDGNTWSYTAYDEDATVELKSINVQLSMDEIYRGIDFEEPLMED